MSYRLTREADLDIEAIFEDGLSRFGHARALRYVKRLHEVLAELVRFPRMARERTEVDPPVRLWPYQSHLIVYRLENDGIVVLRVRHGHEDWQRD